MFKSLTGIVYRGRWVVVVCAVVLADFAGYYGGPVAGLLTDDDSNFEDPASESVAAEERLAHAADANPGANIVALVEAGEGVKSSAGQEKVQDVAGTIADDEAAAVGVGRTGRIITAAALLFCIAIGAFATSQIVFIKELGVGAALAVIIDATIVRALLVPSLMKLLGRFNWWSPRPLKWLHERIGLREGTAADKA